MPAVPDTTATRPAGDAAKRFEARRRAAALRVPPCCPRGCRDPLALEHRDHDDDRPQVITATQLESWRQTVLHLIAAGLPTYGVPRDVRDQLRGSA